MELLVGAGRNWDKKIKFEKIPEKWVELLTLDIDPTMKCDYTHDLEDLPLPFDDNCFDEIHAYDVLEHTGQQGDWRFFFNQFYEFWRIMKPGGYLCGSVPMWDKKWAWGDPGHKRVLTIDSFAFLSQQEYANQVGKTAMTDYRPYWEGDFATIGCNEENNTLSFALQAIKE